LPTYGPRRGARSNRCARTFAFTSPTTGLCGSSSERASDGSRRFRPPERQILRVERESQARDDHLGRNVTDVDTRARGAMAGITGQLEDRNTAEIEHTRRTGWPAVGRRRAVPARSRIANVEQPPLNSRSWLLPVG
jgi:hypothetical protein